MEQSMSGIRAIVTTVSALLSLAVTLPADAQALKDQAVGAWTLTSIFEEFGDVKKDTWGPDVKGALLLDRSGQFALQITAAGRAKGSGDPSRSPIGRVIAYFGTYTISEADKTLTFNIVRSSFPNWDGTEQKRILTIAGDKMSYRAAAPIPSADGPFIPVIEWARAK
jgi:Lipocalin-like domain